MSGWLWWLVLGLLIGWLIEWAIDWFYWRRRGAVSGTELATVRAERDRLQSELQTARAQVQQHENEIIAFRANNDANTQLQSELASARTAAQQCQQHVATLQMNLIDLQGDNNRLRDELETTRVAPLAIATTARDPLIDINGIGPVYQKRLYDAGVTTFAELAAQTPERVREIVQAEDWQAPAIVAWLAEANQLAQRSAT